MTRGTVLLAGTFDTKGAEYAFVRQAIVDTGLEVLTMDLGVLAGDAPPFRVDVSAEEVATAGGSPLAALRARGDRGEAIAVMLAGARVLTRRLQREGRFDGMLGLGGGGGTAMITAAMRSLPVGVPKVMVSTMASGNTAPYVDVKDITMMYSVVDIAGLNPLSRKILANAAMAVCGMVGGAGGATAAEVPGGHAPRPLLAATMFGVTTPCVTAARQRLEAAGFEVLVFHATGSGGRAMEGLITDGWFAGVLDVTTTEWSDEVVGGVLSAGPDRLGAAARSGVPQVVSVGALDMVNFGARATVPPRFDGRRFHVHNEAVTLMRTTPDECVEIARRMVAQLMHATAPVVVVLPLRGVSAIDAPGQPFHDPAADAALFSALREGVAAASVQNPHLRWREVDAHVNDRAFAEALTVELLSLLPRHTH